jgi:hypothetical protein
MQWMATLRYCLGMVWIRTIMSGLLAVGLGGCIQVPVILDEDDIGEVKVSAENLEKVPHGRSIALVSAMNHAGKPIDPDDSLVECLGESFVLAMSPTKVISPQDFEELQIAKGVEFVRYRPGTLPHNYYPVSVWLDTPETREIVFENEAIYLVVLNESSISRNVDNHGMSFATFGALAGSEEQLNTLTASIYETEGMKEIGSISVTTMAEVGGAGVILMPFGAGFRTFPIYGSTLCKEMAMQLIKVFGGGKAE